MYEIEVEHKSKRGKVLFQLRDQIHNAFEKAFHVSKEKKVSEKFEYATAFTNRPGSWPTFIQLLLTSIIRSHETLPLVRIVYLGEEPQYLKTLSNFVTLHPMIWSLAGNKKGSQARFNFCGKMEALLACTKDSCWIDTDLIMKKPLYDFIGNNIFINKTKRVAGGFYCIKQNDKASVIGGILEEIRKGEIAKAKSDQKLIRKALLARKIDFSLIKSPEPDFFWHADKSKFSSLNKKEDFIREVQQLCDSF